MNTLGLKAERKEKQYEAVRKEAQQFAWKLIEEKGVAALSLRAVAAKMGLTAPALYRYFPSKNHLITALIMDAFQSLTKVQESVLTSAAGEPWQEVFLLLGNSYRSWALKNPSAFFLIFGNAIPEYEPHWQETMPIAGASMRPLMYVLQRAAEEGALKLPLTPPPTSKLQQSLESWSASIHEHINTEVLYLSFIITTRVQGLMLVELGNQLPPFFTDGEELFKRELLRVLEQLWLIQE